MAYAKLAELDVEYGLYSSFMGVLIYWFFATSKDITIGVGFIRLVPDFYYSNCSPADIFKACCGDVDSSRFNCNKSSSGTPGV